jgi:sulfur carrier protein ThiS
MIVCDFLTLTLSKRLNRQMKITIESLGLPTLAAVVGKKAELEVQPGTLAEIIDQLIGRFGPKLRHQLLDGEGNLDYTIQITVNDEGFVPREDLPTRELKDGDRVRFMLIAGGG